MPFCSLWGVETIVIILRSCSQLRWSFQRPSIWIKESLPVRFCSVVDLSIPKDAANVSLEDVQCGVVAARRQPLLYLADVNGVLHQSADLVCDCLAIHCTFSQPLQEDYSACRTQAITPPPSHNNRHLQTCTGKTQLSGCYSSQTCIDSFNDWRSSPQVGDRDRDVQWPRGMFCSPGGWGGRTLMTS